MMPAQLFAPARAATSKAAPALLAPAILLAALFALPAYGQGYAVLGTGQAVFVSAGCDSCHAYVARRAAPSVRDLMRQFEGEPEEVADATRASRAHRKDVKFPELAEADMRSIAQWLGQVAWPEDEPAPVIVATPVAVIPPMAMAAPSAPEMPVPRAPVINNTSRVAIAAIRVSKGPARTDRLIVELRGGEPDMIDLQRDGEKLVVSLAGVRLGDAVAKRLVNWPDSRVVSAVESIEQEKSVELLISARVAAWTYTGTQGKSRLTIDLTAAAKQPKPVVVAGPAKAVAAPKIAAKAAPKPVVKAATKAASAPKSSVAAAPGVARAAAAAASSVVTAAAVVAAAPAAEKPAAPPPVQLAMAKPALEPAAPVIAKAAPKERGKKLKYRDGSDLDPCPPARPEDQVIGAFDSDQVKEIMDRIGCPQCHAYVAKKTGPPFREVLKKYKGDPACVIHRLKTNETHKEEGVTTDIAPQEFKLLADYVASRFLK